MIKYDLTLLWFNINTFSNEYVTLPIVKSFGKHMFCANQFFYLYIPANTHFFSRGGGNFLFIFFLGPVQKAENVL